MRRGHRRKQTPRDYISAGTPSGDAYWARMGSEVEDLRDNAERCRRLARVVEDERNKRLLLEMAMRLDEQADQLEAAVRSDEG